MVRKFFSPEDTQQSRRPALSPPDHALLLVSFATASRCLGLHLRLSEHLVVEGACGSAGDAKWREEAGEHVMKGRPCPQSPLRK